jgi:hypothetical protein
MLGPTMLGPTVLGRARPVAAAGLLGGVCGVWAATPLTDGVQAAVLVVAALCVLADVIRLAVPVTAFADVNTFSSTPERLAGWAAAVLKRLPLAEGAALAALILEVRHPARPWHTGLLGAALLCYLLATHLAESHAPLRVLRPQLPVLIAGLGLLALGTGAALLPAAAPGPGAGLLRVLAAIAAIAAGVLVLPL